MRRISNEPTDGSFSLHYGRSYRCVVLVGMLSLARQLQFKPAEQTVLFSDDFSGDLSQWSDPIGDWSIDQGELVGYGWGGGVDAWIYAADTALTDYSLQAKVIFVNSNANFVLRSTGHWQDEYRLDFWQQGGENSNSYQVSKYQDGVVYELSGGLVPSSVSITNPSVIKVLVSGNRLFLYINSHFVDEIEDPDPLSNGRFGLGVVWNYSARFDDVIVTTLPPIFILQPEQEKYGKPGYSVIYTIELENDTGAIDSFNLDILPGNLWPTSLSNNQVGPIEDGESITFTVSVDVPPDAQPGAIDTATIQASSVNNPTDTATTKLNTTATSEELAYVPMRNSNALALIDAQTHTTLGSIDVAQYGCTAPQRARLTPNGAELYLTCDGSSNILILKTVDLSSVATIDRPGTCEQDIAFVREGAYALASTNNCGGVYQIDVIDTETHSIVQAIPLMDYQVISIAAHPSLPLAYAASTQCCYTGSVLVIDTNNFTIQTAIPYPGIVWDVQPSPDGSWVYASEYFGTGLAKIDVNTNTIVNTLPNYGKFGLDISPDGSRIYATEMWDGVVHVIDTINMELITTIGIGATTAEAELTCDGSELYVARETTSIPVINTHTNNISYEISIPGTSSAYGIAICPQNLSDIYSRKIVDKPTASPGAHLNYAIIATNIITDSIDNVTITDTLPISLTYKEGTLNASSGMAYYLDGVITWTGEISPSTTVTVSFGVIVSPTATIGTSITNEAIISYEGNIYKRSATIDIVPYKVYMPCASRACLPSYTENFSNPSSGWPDRKRGGLLDGLSKW